MKRRCDIFGDERGRKRRLKTVDELQAEVRDLENKRLLAEDVQKHLAEQFWAQADQYFYGIRLHPTAYGPYKTPVLVPGNVPSGICAGCFRDVACTVFMGFLLAARFAYTAEFYPSRKTDEDDWLPPMCHLCDHKFTLLHLYHVHVYDLLVPFLKEEASMIPDLASLIRSYVYGIQY